MAHNVFRSDGDALAEIDVMRAEAVLEGFFRKHPDPEPALKGACVSIDGFLVLYYDDPPIGTQGLLNRLARRQGFKAADLSDVDAYLAESVRRALGYDRLD